METSERETEKTGPRMDTNEREAIPKEKPNRRWTQIYADKMDFLRSVYGILLALGRRSRSWFALVTCSKWKDRGGESYGRKLRTNCDRSRFYLRPSAVRLCFFPLFAPLRSLVAP